MIELPDLDTAFEHENAFYLSCATDRVRKLLAQWEIFERAMAVPGVIVECGVFKGASLLRWAMFRDLLGASERRVIAFDTFDSFPEAQLDADRELRSRFIAEAGASSVSVEQMRHLLDHKALANVELIAGDIGVTVPKFVGTGAGEQIALLHVDVDLYEPSLVILEELYPLVSAGGIVILDDFGTFPGATRAAREVLGDGIAEQLESPSFAQVPLYLVKTL